MAKTDTSNPNSLVSTKVKAMLSMLIAQFFAGMALNLIGIAEKSDSTLKKLASGTIGILHILLAIGLFVLAIRLFLKFKNSEDSYIADKLKYGFYDVTSALIFGILTTSVKSYSEIFSFLMAGSFMACLLTYGTLYAKLSSKQTVTNL